MKKVKTLLLVWEPAICLAIALYSFFFYLFGGNEVKDLSVSGMIFSGIWLFLIYENRVAKKNKANADKRKSDLKHRPFTIYDWQSNGMQPVTRDGREIKNLRINPNPLYLLSGEVDGVHSDFTSEGFFIDLYNTNEKDVFLVNSSKSEQNDGKTIE